MIVFMIIVPLWLYKLKPEVLRPRNFCKPDLTTSWALVVCVLATRGEGNSCSSYLHIRTEYLYELADGSQSRVK